MTNLTAVLNVERLEGSQFLVINLYDKYLIDNIIAPYEGPAQAIERLKELTQIHLAPITCLTSQKHIYSLMLSTPGINGVMKHYSETTETASSLRDAEEILRDLYDIEPFTSLPMLSEWRKRLFFMLLKITNKIGGNGRYEI
ncbi:hypothetical protein V7075_07830 [Neobacillus drentensis]|uniref:hypothetical protein n=1 Tax=Neobacillus drentensis TaxID=220684 RepID=UPI002FFF2B2A